MIGGTGRAPSGRMRKATILVLLVVGVAAVLRLYDLELRPPHHDEGVNGWFVERILRSGYYEYDPANYHGPLYFYLLAGTRRLLGFGLWQLRLPGALIGIAACLLPLLLRRRIGGPAAIASCAFLAVSPTLVYYARYAIHETLLAALGLLAAACVLRWAASGRAGWLFGAAAAIAGMVATKETTVLFLAAAGLWLAGEVVVESLRARRLMVLGRPCTPSVRTVVLAVSLLAVMCAIHVVAYTGAFRVPGHTGAQLWRSVQAYFLWQDTGTGETGHNKAAWYYLLIGARYELVLYAFALLGTVAGFRERAVRGPGLVGLAMLGLYSLIPYKMPWLPMSWLALLALPAGHGLVVVLRFARAKLGRVAAAGALVAALAPAVAITWRSSFVDPADKQEALAYAHTDAAYDEWFGYVRAAARTVGARNLWIGVDSEVTWPLPWLLTPYRYTRWSARGDEHVIIAAQSRAKNVERRLTGRYLRRTFPFRDGAEPMVVYLREQGFSQILDESARASMTVVGPSPLVQASARSAATRLQ